MTRSGVAARSSERRLALGFSVKIVSRNPRRSQTKRTRGRERPVFLYNSVRYLFSIVLKLGLGSIF
jgi:hypothetical protein